MICRKFGSEKDYNDHLSAEGSLPTGFEGKTLNKLCHTKKIV